MSEQFYHRYTVGSDVRFIGFAANNPEYTGARATVLDFQSNETGTKYVIMFYNGILGIVGEAYLEPWLEETTASILNDAIDEMTSKPNAEDYYEDCEVDSQASWNRIKEITGWKPNE